MNDDTEADIEIQLTELKVWAERSRFYLAKMYAEQILSGQKYGVFKKCVSISVLDFDLFRGRKRFSTAVDGTVWDLGFADDNRRENPE